MIVLEYVDRRGRRAFTDDGLSVRDRRALNAELDRLSQHKLEMVIGSILHRGGAPHIHRMKVKGDVQLRPRFCLGPNRDRAIYLVGVGETGGQESPGNAGDIAVQRRVEIMVGNARTVRLRDHVKERP